MKLEPNNFNTWEEAFEYCKNNRDVRMIAIVGDEKRMIYRNGYYDIYSKQINEDYNPNNNISKLKMNGVF